MPRLFGTDGVRGVANVDLTGELAYALGRASVVALNERGTLRPRVLIGRDTRSSGEFLEAALAAGICSAGGDVARLGILPTPAVAHLVVADGGHAGAVISASHNPAEYNGIKLFSREGYKLPDRVEDEIERMVREGDGPRPQGGDIGRISDDAEAAERYVEFVTGSAGTLAGLRLVVDCANGAAFHVGPEALRRLGAEVVAINDEPNGQNINAGCGATDPEVVARAVVEHRADAGVAFDGDADRALFADADGNVVDGDQVLAAAALSLREEGRLKGDTVVSTVMANLGFRRAMDEAGVRFLETKVGDRYVLEEMLSSGAVLGGEQSGHVIFLEDSTTGDGVLTAARFLSIAVARGTTVAGLAGAMQRFPQVLLNVEVRDRDALEGAGDVWSVVWDAERELGERGRILVRPSGTEMLVRVMVEAPTEATAREHAERVAAVVRERLG
jgi:phosphoglucosamine mutase